MTRTPLPAGTTGPGAWTEIDNDSGLYQNRSTGPVELTFSASEPGEGDDVGSFLLASDEGIMRESRTGAAWARTSGSFAGRIDAG